MRDNRQESIERSAEAIRQRLFLYDSLPIDIPTALVRLGDLDLSPKAAYEVLSDSEMKDNEAFAYCAKNRLYISKSTFLAAKRGSKRARFTIAHEIGHLVLRHTGVRSRVAHGKDPRKQSNIAGVWQEEADANQWASAFVMPKKVVLATDAPLRLAERCQVSMAAAMNRIESIRRLIRKENGQPREIPQRTLPLLKELFVVAGTKPKHSLNLLPASVRGQVAADEAMLQGYLPEACGDCGNRRLVREGGCTTCLACGASDCQ